MIAWMNWTPTVAIFFAVIAGILAVMTVYEIVSPCTERKGFLPIATTRGDRLFIGLLSAAYIPGFPGCKRYHVMGGACGFGGLAIGAAALGMSLRSDVRYVVFCEHPALEIL